MNYYHNPLNGELIAYDENTGNISVLTPLSFAAQAETVEQEVPARGKVSKKKTGKGCPDCGSLSKHKSSCPRSISSLLKVGTTKGPVGKKARARPAPCPECGSKGSRHFKICSQKERRETIPSFAPNAESESTLIERPPLTAEEYADVRAAMHNKEFQSARYALTNKLPPREVNGAVVSRNYRDYLDKRDDV